MSMIAQFKSYKPCGKCVSDREEIKDYFMIYGTLTCIKKQKN